MLDTDKMQKDMAEFTAKLKEKGYNTAVDNILASRDYIHVATDMNARLVLMEVPEKMCYKIIISTNSTIGQPENFFEKEVEFEELMKYSIRVIMNRYFAESVMNHILNNIESQSTIGELKGYLDGHHPSNK
ncbi:hypothetical protein COPG_00027 [Colwellia phage 9A]|uniref:Uncharacterized protein n=1 Tax=Colwellia phage 9A TaxID=765765 RepID=I3UMA8_9CAUD|nr:hypothetical protein COPG_00027 [Colwellia phage 9A]AFK66623.1 hypothetical protein COPG_00027 [Colwellia phage 9A]